MSATSAPADRGFDRPDHDRTSVTDGAARRFSTETKSAFKTTEFVAFLAVGILVCAAIVKASAGHHGDFTAAQAWLYVSIVAVGYMISRGLAKSGPAVGSLRRAVLDRSRRRPQ
jgi:hypothetical protein